MPISNPQELQESQSDDTLPAADKPVLQRRVPLQQRGQQTLDQILHAAQQVIATEGLDKLTTKRVATEAGLSVGSVYEYFPNKEAVLCALVRQWFDQLVQVLDAHHPSRTGVRDLLRYLEESLDAVRQVYVDQPALGALISALEAIPDLQDLVVQHDERITAAVADACSVIVPTVALEDLRDFARSVSLMSHEFLSEALVRNPARATQITRHMKVCLFALISQVLLLR